MTDFTKDNVWALIRKAIALFSHEPMPQRIETAFLAMKTARDPKLTSFGSFRVGNKEVEAAAEHYLLCRAWVGNGKVNRTQMRSMVEAYNIKKRTIGVNEHNPGDAPSPWSPLQEEFQYQGIADGETDRKSANIEEAGWTAKPLWVGYSEF